MVMSTILEIKNLVIGYEKALIEPINFNINKGELIGIIGKNGIGKSTLLKTLMRIIPPLSGEILLENQNLNNLNTNNFAQKLAVVLTEKIPLSQFTVYEILKMGRFPHSNWLFKMTNKDNEVLEKVIETTQLQELVYKKAHQLSDGMLQKVMIARALVQDTPFILLDEPTTFLDLENTFQIFELLKKISQEQQKTILFSTHQLEITLQICSKIILISDSKAILETPTYLIENNYINSIFTSDKVKFNKGLRKFEYGF